MRRVAAGVNADECMRGQGAAAGATNQVQAQAEEMRRCMVHGPTLTTAPRIILRALPLTKRLFYNLLAFILHKAGKHETKIAIVPLIYPV